MTSYVRGAFTLNAHQKPTVGDSKFSVINHDHMGWLKCDGSSKPVSEFYLLWRVIGYSFGGSGDTFKLPDARGTVPGVVGEGTDANMSSFTYALGQQVGEYNHTLTIAEMPTHNHGVEGDAQPNNNQTSASVTGITINFSTTGVYDSGHTHSYINNTNNQGTDNIGNTESAADNADLNATTGTGTANIVDPQHRHSINDPTHYHTINSAGGSNYHNNIQPTLPIGNMFIYSGRPTYPFGGFPYTEGKAIL